MNIFKAGLNWLRNVTGSKPKSNEVSKLTSLDTAKPPKGYSGVSDFKPFEAPKVDLCSSAPGSSAWKSLSLDQLDEATESEAVKANGGAGLLMAVGAHKPDATPVVMVHGIKGNPGDFRTLAKELESDPARQPYVFLYEDVHRSLDKSSVDLASELRRLGEGCGDKKPSVQLVAHSMGGLVARGALNTLSNPTWLSKDPKYSQTPSEVEGFRRIDLMAIDTPWHGFGRAPGDVKKLMPKEASYWDLVSKSHFLERLVRQPLPWNVHVKLIGADNAAAGAERDGIRRLEDISGYWLKPVMNYVKAGYSGFLKPRVKNVIDAARSDRDFAQFAEAIRPELERGEVTPEEFRQRMKEAIPSYAGTHTSVLENPELIDEIERMGVGE